MGISKDILKSIDFDSLIELLVEEGLDIETVISEFELDDEVEVEDLIDELEKNDVLQCSECESFDYSDNFVKGLEFNVCVECNDSTMSSFVSNDDF
jgi:hypothetical protein